MDLDFARRPKYRTVLVPYLPIEYNTTLRLAKPLTFLGKKLLIFFSYLPEYLYSSDIYVEPEVYASVSLLTFIVYLLLLNGLFVFLQMNPMILDSEKELLMDLQLPVSLLVSSVLAFQVMNYPVLLAKRRAWQTDRELGNVLRHLTIEVRSGATIFEAMQDIARADYGVVSKDMADIVNSVNSGLSFEEAVEYVVVKTKSENFRRMLLQIQSAVSSGSNMGEVLMQMSRNYFQEQQIRIQQYGRDLEFYARVFLLMTVIMPVMFSIMLSMTALMPILNLSSGYLYILLGIVAMFQVMFLTYAREKRPPIYE